jgi:hypothetical protein
VWGNYKIRKKLYCCGAGVNYRWLNLGWNNTKTVGDNEASFPVPYGPGGSISGKVTKRKGTWTSFRWPNAWPSGVSCDTGTCVNKKLWGECRITTCLDRKVEDSIMNKTGK